MADIAELFARDPLSLTDDDIDEVIKAFRDMRYKFNLGDTRAGKVAKTPKALEKAEADELKDLLGDTGGLKI